MGYLKPLAVGEDKPRQEVPTRATAATVTIAAAVTKVESLQACANELDDEGGTRGHAGLQKR